jgi:hypothetical protein
MAKQPDETIKPTDQDLAAADALEEAIDAVLERGRTSPTFLCEGELHTSSIVVRHLLAERYRKTRWHVYDVEATDLPLRLEAPR